MKRQKWLTGILAVMLVASFLLAVVSFVAPSPARAAGGGGAEPEAFCGLCQKKTECCNCRPTICGQTPPNYYLYQLYECYTDDPECEQYWVHVCNYTQCQP